MTLTGEIPPNVTGYHSVDLLWTLADSRRARREGWDIFATPQGRFAIDGVETTERMAMPQVLAMRHCLAMAEASRLHAKALTIHFHSLATREK